MILFTLLASGSPAFALTQPMRGPSLDVGVGLGLTGQPVGAGLSVQASAGFWGGRWDEAYALGRYWQVGLTGRGDIRPGQPSQLAGMVELRRGIEVIVAGVSPFLAGGLVGPVGGDGSGALGWTARGGLISKFRWHRYHGATLRLSVGADVISGTPAFSGAVLLGFAFSRPVKRRSAESSATDSRE